jgi:hypothetical protein
MKLRLTLLIIHLYSLLIIHVNEHTDIFGVQLWTMWSTINLVELFFVGVCGGWGQKNIAELWKHLLQL